MEDEEIERKLEKCSKLIAKSHKIIAENTCNKPKDIGDKVKIWDWSANQDLETGEHYYCFDEIAKDTMIIIEKNCKNIWTLSESSREINRDIVVYSPKYNRKIATSMNFVKLVENERE